MGGWTFSEKGVHFFFAAFGGNQKKDPFFFRCLQRRSFFGLLHTEVFASTFGPACFPPRSASAGGTSFDFRLSTNLHLYTSFFIIFTFFCSFTVFFSPFYALFKGFPLFSLFQFQFFVQLTGFWCSVSLCWVVVCMFYATGRMELLWASRSDKL